ncbi:MULTISPECIES: 3-oxoacyl-ACP reductase [Psychrobacter]|jgi:3-oxoacyl-[acyl-carrier protein] reductase|uniref:3-oxoacyl-ACP reductase n=1 Tax=Psychrobacter TaxID=497 RepID=UPI000E95AB74|nr:MULTISPECIES: 3-oxoacyl-ACP reductase [Psychrobacter]MBP7956646.1 3-oxoacyl-ACP reductase [Psychrobacter sp.]MBK3392779.1 3-oxoacyl-ACP reductase [Psychrobacter sp. M9-54-1]TSB22736.1 3-oxoacyl-ACP reductase [Psychrobacter sp. YGAH215]WLW65432.1 3-oxoacyl-ACP reductase [Psychrobacter sp. van23A]HAV48357.1 3-oxoacyl-ACP reductase [Psychrobacter sp.]
MSDRYGDFVQSSIGRKVAKNLGLPMPVELDRFDSGQPSVRGSVLVGRADGDNTAISESVARILSDLHADVFVNSRDAVKDALADAGVKAKANTGGDDKFKVLLFDASNISNADELKQVYEFFHAVARRVEKSGRVIVIGRPPEDLKDIEAALAQRSLEGFVKSVGKEFKRGITAQLIYVAEGAEKNLDSTLRFFASARSAYVSGQVVRVTNGANVDVDWTQPLGGKTMLVTGASRGIGEAIARVLAREGAHVICLDVPQQQADLQKVASEISGSVLTVDITSEDAGKEIAEAAQKRGGLDAVIHNAGVTRDKTLAKMDEKKWDMVININLGSIAKLNRYLLDNDVLKDHARIVCVSSISGIAGNLGQSNYATSKAGVIGLVNATAKQLDDGSKGMTINAVAPGFIETQMTEAIPFAIREAGRRMNSMSQGGLPIDVAETIAWLASPASGGLNGNIVRVCGQSLLGA